jgi:two-component system response regulator FlrC
MSAIRKVLVVDDDPVVGKSFTRVLSQKGYAVITAESGAQALEKMRNEEYDVVFTDIGMPGMDGLELAEQVKAKRPWMPVVIVTGYGTTANEARARNAGVAAFLSKPLSPEMIEESTLQALQAGVPFDAGVQEAVPVVAVRAEAVGAVKNLKNVALFLSAPFIGLIYAVMLPFVGMGMMVWLGVQALRKGSVAK